MMASSISSFCNSIGSSKKSENVVAKSDGIGDAAQWQAKHARE